MTIKDFIINQEYNFAKERLEKLKQIKAPEIMLTTLSTKLDELSSNNIKISGDTETLDIDYINHVWKKGRGGKAYISFNDEEINYFPNARFGLYIKKRKENK